MALLEMRDATFVRDGETLLAPTSLRLEAGNPADRTFETALAAGIAARFAAAIVRPTRGRVLVGDFEPRIQPVQVKRLVGFVPHGGCCLPRNPSAYLTYRAALWGLDAQAALRRAQTMLGTLSGLPPAESLLLAGALLHEPQLLVMERPTARMREAARNVCENATIFATYGPADAAPAITPGTG